MYIEGVVDGALKDANFSVNDLDAIAVTNRPGKAFIGERKSKLDLHKFAV